MLARMVDVDVFDVFVKDVFVKDVCMWSALRVYVICLTPVADVGPDD
jgi:hypothetical protein